MTTNPFESKIKSACKVTGVVSGTTPAVYVNKCGTIRINIAAMNRLDISKYLQPNSKRRLNVNFYINKLENTLIIEFTADGIYTYNRNSGSTYNGIRKTLAMYSMAPMAPGSYEITSMYADLEKSKYYVEIPLYGKHAAVEQNAEQV